MPVRAGPSPLLPPAFPSFSSVVGNGIDSILRLDRQEAQGRAGQMSVPPSTSFESRGSVSSSVPSESTESSPTTTISTFDTPSGTDTSPNSSPESPSSMSLPYPKPLVLPDNPPKKSTAPASSDAARPESQQRKLPALRSTSPGRRGRNLKNLSLKVPTQPSRPAVATAAVMESTQEHDLSAPPSPIFHPLKSARRKPANLTIQTPRFEPSHYRTELVPPTPSTTQPSLRRFESTPSLGSVFSPTTAPPDGLQPPRPATRDGPYCGSGRTSQTWLLQQVDEEEYSIDSRESLKRNERGYPNGPVKIYDSGVYLYLEPTREEACQFDVVVNVAKEVKNPFLDPNNGRNAGGYRRSNSPFQKRYSIADPTTASSETPFSTAFETQPTRPDSPTGSSERKEEKLPEYVHVPWDHNSEILDDLYPLCELIDDRISQGKTVLVHCQLGASRSASLVIAYGLYKNRHLDFNDMYDIVKSRSCWVGPNMSLIYQLTDFRSRLQRGIPSTPPSPDWFKMGPHAGQSSQSALPEPMDTSEDASEDRTKVSRRESPKPRGPEENKPGMFKAPQFSSATERPRLRRISPRPLPLREKYETGAPGPAPAEPASHMHARFPSIHMELGIKEPPISPSVLSPRAASFIHPSISRTLAGSVAPDSPAAVVEFGQPAFDPRSPPQRHEPLIMRNIDEFL
ncbi:hypothetical protein VTN49DRAFT_6429 [Thermomyces lanuginosus]|uniref:uncharacterized protein n=1 Tax=Thermomyces lanuginosus TaxID=5541 RepID=UPI003743BD41